MTSHNNKKMSIQNKIQIVAKIFLIAFIPLFLLGFNKFGKTQLYSWLFNIYGIESALSKRLTTQFNDPHRLTIDRLNNEKEFDDLWKLIRLYSKSKFPVSSPQIISRFAVENCPYVIIPGRDKEVNLIPDSTPIVALYCSKQQVTEGKCSNDKSIIVGTVGDIKDWLEKKKGEIRSTIDLILSILSIILGLLLEFKPSKG
jgi:hypothetical protein